MLASGEVDERPVPSAWYGGYHDRDLAGRAGTPGPPTPTAGSRSRGSGATASPGWNSTAPAGGRHARRDGPAGEGPAEAPRRIRRARSRDMMFYGSPPEPQLVGATFEHIAGPTKPIIGVVRLKGTGKPVEGVRVYGQEGATWTLGRGPDRRRRAASASSACPRASSTRSAPTTGTGIDPFLGARDQSPTPRGSSRSRRRSRCPGA